MAALCVLRERQLYSWPEFGHNFDITTLLRKIGSNLMGPLRFYSTILQISSLFAFLRGNKIAGNFVFILRSTPNSVLAVYYTMFKMVELCNT